jgi:hypothetical protein
VDDRSARLRGLLDRSARLVVTDSDGSRTFLAPGGRVDVHLPLAPGCIHRIDLAIVTLDGRRLSAAFDLIAERDLAPVHLIESLANPRGPEPTQEYVELLNTSDARVSLAGYHLTDSEHRLGDVLPDSAFIPPNGRVLLVASGYDANDDRDPSPPPGALLVRLDSSLANAGLANTGEPLYLLDPERRRVSSMPASPVPPEGACLLARTLEDRRPDPDRFVVGPCSPGR